MKSHHDYKVFSTGVRLSENINTFVFLNKMQKFKTVWKCSFVKIHGQNWRRVSVDAEIFAKWPKIIFFEIFENVFYNILKNLKSYKMRVFWVLKTYPCFSFCFNSQNIKKCNFGQSILKMTVLLNFTIITVTFKLKT